MRAAMRAVLDGKQVAVLTPTTVLAFQHWKTFRKRFAPFPVTVEMVSRFRTPKEIKAVLAARRRGQGRHPDRHPPPPLQGRGLPRPGPAGHRRGAALRRGRQGAAEAAPQDRRLPHPLRHADPAHAADGPGRYPRHVGDRDAAEGPPGDPDLDRQVLHRHRSPPRSARSWPATARSTSSTTAWSRSTSLASLVQRLVPEARVAVAHGQMPEAELESAMLAFVEGRADVLVATTIIENGLDIPRANTLIVNRADRYGLAQLYQLRGRVGRSDRRAYAYLLVPPDTVLSRDRAQAPGRHPGVLRARRRLPDRGARPRAARRRQPAGRPAERPHRGGRPRPLREAARADDPGARGEAPQEGPRATLNSAWTCGSRAVYVPEVHQRMSLYKRVSQARTGGARRAARGDARPLRRAARRGGGAPRLSPAARPKRALALAAGRSRRGALHLRFGPARRSTARRSSACRARCRAPRLAAGRAARPASGRRRGLSRCSEAPSRWRRLRGAAGAADRL